MSLCFRVTENGLDYFLLILQKRYVQTTFEEKNSATHNFLQWYVSEQIEEEATAKSILDKINLMVKIRAVFTCLTVTFSS
jgi:ferritin